MRKVADHLAQGSILAPHTLDIMYAKLIEGNYILNQDDLSTSLMKAALEHGGSLAGTRRAVAARTKLGDNAGQLKTAKSANHSREQPLS
jgi:hypothetical protein